MVGRFWRCPEKRLETCREVAQSCPGSGDRNWVYPDVDQFFSRGGWKFGYFLKIMEVENGWEMDDPGYIWGTHFPWTYYWQNSCYRWIPRTRWDIRRITRCHEFMKYSGLTTPPNKGSRNFVHPHDEAGCCVFWAAVIHVSRWWFWQSQEFR